MHKHEVPLHNIFQYSTGIWWKTVYMQHMSFRSRKRKITLEVPLHNIFQYSTGIWWKTVYMQHMSFRSRKRKITFQAVMNNMYVDEIPTDWTILTRKTRTNTNSSANSIWEDCGHA